MLVTLLPIVFVTAPSALTCAVLDDELHRAWSWYGRCASTRPRAVWGQFASMAAFAAALQSASTSGRPALTQVNYDNGHFIDDKRVAFRNFANMCAFGLWRADYPDFQPNSATIKKPHSNIRNPTKKASANPAEAFSSKTNNPRNPNNPAKSGISFSSSPAPRQSGHIPWLHRRASSSRGPSCRGFPDRFCRCAAPECHTAPFSASGFHEP